MISGDIDSVPQISATVEDGISENHVLGGSAFSRRVIEWVKGNREVAAVAALLLIALVVCAAVCCYKIVARRISQTRWQAEHTALGDRYVACLLVLQRGTRNKKNILNFITSLEKKYLDDNQKEQICNFVDAYVEYYRLRYEYTKSGKTKTTRDEFNKYRLTTFHPLQEELIKSELLPEVLVLQLSEGKEQL